LLRNRAACPEILHGHSLDPFYLSLSGGVLQFIREISQSQVEHRLGALNHSIPVVAWFILQMPVDASDAELPQRVPLAPIREITHKAAIVYTYRLHILDLGLGELRERLLYSASSALALHGIFRGTALTLGNLLVLQTPQAVFVKLAAKRILLTGRIALPGKHRLAEITQDPSCIRSTMIVRRR
jgi:hypothetical protein